MGDEQRTLNLLHRIQDSEYSYELTAEYMTELLTDPSWTTYKMFEQLGEDYLRGDSLYRAGMDAALSALTGYRMETICEEIVSQIAEAEFDGEDPEDQW